MRPEERAALMNARTQSPHLVLELGGKGIDGTLRCASPITFRIRGARFDRMTLARVARYMNAIQRLMGYKTRFIRLTATTLTFERAEEQA